MSDLLHELYTIDADSNAVIACESLSMTYLLDAFRSGLGAIKQKAKPPHLAILTVGVHQYL